MTSFDIKIEWISPLKINNTIRTYTMGFSWTRKHKNGQRNVIVFHILVLTEQFCNAALTVTQEKFFIIL